MSKESLNGQIAVFGKGIRKFNPPDLLIEVKSVDDLFGKKIIGIIYVGNWFQNAALRDAHNFLIESRKELFRNP